MLCLVRGGQPLLVRKGEKDQTVPSFPRNPATKCRKILIGKMRGQGVSRETVLRGVRKEFMGGHPDDIRGYPKNGHGMVLVMQQFPSESSLQKHRGVCNFNARR